MKLTNVQARILSGLADGHWHPQTFPCSDNIRRRMHDKGLIDQDVARGKMYGITHPTRIRITDTGRAALGAHQDAIGAQIRAALEKTS